MRLFVARAVASALAGLPAGESLAHGVHLEAELAADAHARRVAGDAALRESLSLVGEHWLRQDVAAAGLAAPPEDFLRYRLCHHLGEPAPHPSLPSAGAAAAWSLASLGVLSVLMLAVEGSERWSTWCLM